jgi:hypothetical protein
VGLYQILGAADRVGHARFERAADMAVSQITIRRILNSLVASPPQPPAPPAPAAPPPADEGDEEEQEEDEEGEESDRAATLPAPDAAPASPPMFDLWWQEHALLEPIDPDDPYAPREASSRTVVLPFLEVVLTEPPVALRTASERIDEEALEHVDEVHAEEALRRTDRLAETVRGRIEVVEDPWGGEGWMLQWRPTEPPGLPFVLISSIASAPDGSPALAWSALATAEAVDSWADSWTATIPQDFPLAIELQFETLGGERVNWLFEVHVTVPGGGGTGPGVTSGGTPTHGGGNR